jgi:hypothetical protein
MPYYQLCFMKGSKAMGMYILWQHGYSFTLPLLLLPPIA